MPDFPLLSDASVLLFRFRPCPPAEEMYPRYAAWLDPQERQRLGRFRFNRHRQEFLHGRALTRFVLAHYLDVKPGDLVFSSSENGKPHVAGDAPVHFNLTHSHGTCVLAVSVAGSVGVDLERVDTGNDRTGIAERYFSKTERDFLRVLPETERRSMFTAMWTLKESYIKATGQGLSLPLSHFTCEIRPPELRLLLPGESADGNSWHSELARFDDGCFFAHTVAFRGTAPKSGYFDLVPGVSLAALPLVPLARGCSVTAGSSMHGAT